MKYKKKIIILQGKQGPLSAPLPRDAPDVGFPASPCIDICQLDGNGVCVGCKRTIAEIAQWPTMSADEQWRVVRVLPERRKSSP